jgi:hypothetical protein
VGQPGPAAAENGLAARVAMARWRAHDMITEAAVSTVARAMPAHHWARCGSVCGMSTIGVEATR